MDGFVVGMAALVWGAVTAGGLIVNWVLLLLIPRKVLGGIYLALGILGGVGLFWLVGNMNQWGWRSGTDPLGARRGRGVHSGLYPAVDERQTQRDRREAQPASGLRFGSW